MATDHAQTDDYLMKAPEVAKLLGVSVKALLAGQSGTHDLPVLMLGKQNTRKIKRWSHHQVQAWIKQKADEATTAPSHNVLKFEKNPVRITQDDIDEAIVRGER